MTAAIKITIVTTTEPPTAMAMIAHMGNPTSATAGWRKRKEGGEVIALRLQKWGVKGEEEGGKCMTACLVITVSC